MAGNSLDHFRCNTYRIRIMKTIVISLGGSLIVPDEIDVSFLRQFKDLILSFKGYRFAIYCGGGSIARKYQKALGEIVDDKESLDWVGIAATYLNAFLVKCVFGENAGAIIGDPTLKVKSNKRILIAAGWKPGWSTDYDAVLLAKNLKADMVINMTNVDYVYDKDPKLLGAKPLKKVSFKDIKKIIDCEWKPGLNMPFDPVAVREAEKLDIRVIICGRSIDNLRNVIEDKNFKGTTISK